MRESTRYLRKGSWVTISLTPGDIRVTPGMWIYDGERAVISRVCKSKKLKVSESNAYGFELEGVVSKYGTPYTFTREMIY